MHFLYGFIAGFLALFVAQLVFNYNFSDWVKDHFFALIGRVESAAHARVQRAKALIAKEENKIEFWKRKAV